MSALRQSKDNFYKKVSSSKGFGYQQNKGEIYSTLVQMLKSDLFQIQEMINSNSSEIKMYKLLSKIPGLTKKLSDIEESSDIHTQVERITEDSKNIEKIGKSYGCQSMNELIQKMMIELNFNELLMKKIVDFLILIKLKICNDDTYQDSLSKVLPLKTFIEKLQLRLATNKPPEVKEPSTSAQISPEDKKKIEEYDQLMKLSTLNELIGDNAKDLKLFNHITKLVFSYFQNMSINSNQMIKDICNKNLYPSLKGNEIEKYFAIQEEIKALLKEYKTQIDNDDSLSKIEAIRKELEEKKEEEIQKLEAAHQSEIKTYQEKIESLQLELQKIESQPKQEPVAQNPDLKYTEKEFNEMKVKLESEIKAKKTQHDTEIKALNDTIAGQKEEISRLKSELESKGSIEKKPSNVSSVSESNVDIQDLIRKHENNFKKFQKETSSELEGEIRNLTAELNKHKEKVNSLTIEIQHLKKQLNEFHSKNFNPDSYEQVLLEQFETMKQAFVKKVDDLTDELSQTKSETRVQVYNLQQELNETKHLKDVFLQQVISLQKQLNL